MSKEYNGRHYTPLVNPGFTLEEYEREACDGKEEGFALGYHRPDTRGPFIPTIDGKIVN